MKLLMTIVLVIVSACWNSAAAQQLPSERPMVPPASVKARLGNTPQVQRRSASRLQPGTTLPSDVPLSTRVAMLNKDRKQHPVQLSTARPMRSNQALGAKKLPSEIDLKTRKEEMKKRQANSRAH